MLNFAIFSIIKRPKIQTPYILLSTNNYFSCREAEYLIYMLTIHFVRIYISGSQRPTAFTLHSRQRQEGGSGHQQVQ